MALNIPDFARLPDKVEAFTALPQATRVALNIHKKTLVAAQTLNQMACLLITAGHSEVR